MFLIGTTGPDQSEETFNRRSRSNTPETHPVNRNSQGEKLNKFGLRSVGKPAAFPNRFNFKPKTAPAAFHSAIGKFPGSRKLAFCTSHHS
jgi:hypothetical protein